MQVYATIRYDKRAQIGVGQGMNSMVFLADDPHLHREVAVKEIDLARIAPGGWDEYHREAQTMFASRHDHVVPIHYACMTASHLCLAMPYYRNGSLHDRISAGPVSLLEGYRVADRTLSALSQIHVANVLHFDLKPSNVLFSDRDEPLIADFGQARMMDSRGLSAAPPMYRHGIPPEVFDSGVGTVESDLYQAGLTFYRAFNGDPFFESQVSRLRHPLVDAIRSGRFPNRDRFLPHVPDGIRRVIRKALRVDPSNRYHSAFEFQDALGRVSVPHDWTTELQAAGEVIWRCSRAGMAGLEVRQVNGSRPGRWNVEVYTTRDSGARRRGVSDLWGRDLRGVALDRHLRAVFTALASE